jgi:hypothetical protein
MIGVHHKMIICGKGQVVKTTHARVDLGCQHTQNLMQNEPFLALKMLLVLMLRCLICQWAVTAAELLVTITVSLPSEIIGLAQ